MPRNKQFSDWCLLVLCNLIWGSQFVFYKIVQKQAGPIFAVFLPMTIAAITLTFVVRHQKSSERANRKHSKTSKDVGRFILLGVVGQAMPKPLTAFGVRLTLASNAALVVLTLPVVTAVLAHFLLKEKMSNIRWLCFALAILGVLEISGIRMRGLSLASGQFAVGTVMIFCAMIGSAFYNCYGKRLLQRYSPLEVLLYSEYAASAFLLPIAIVAEPQSFARLPTFSISVWAGMLSLALLDYSLSIALFLAVLSRLDAIQAGLSTYLMPLFGVIIAAVALHERVSGTMIVGGGLILVGTMFITIFDRPTPLSAPHNTDSSVNSELLLEIEQRSEK